MLALIALLSMCKAMASPYFYAPDSTGNSIKIMDMNTTSGELIGSFETISTPRFLASHPSGRWIYVASNTQLQAYDANAYDESLCGSPSNCPHKQTLWTSPASLSHVPTKLIMLPDGKNLLAQTSSGLLLINATTGTNTLKTYSQLGGSGIPEQVSLSSNKKKLYAALGGKLIQLDPTNANFLTEISKRLEVAPDPIPTPDPKPWRYSTADTTPVTALYADGDSRVFILHSSSLLESVPLNNADITTATGTGTYTSFSAPLAGSTVLHVEYSSPYLYFILSGNQNIYKIDITYIGNSNPLAATAINTGHQPVGLSMRNLEERKPFLVHFSDHTTPSLLKSDDTLVATQDLGYNIPSPQSFLVFPAFEFKAAFQSVYKHQGPISASIILNGLLRNSTSSSVYYETKDGLGALSMYNYEKSFGTPQFNTGKRQHDFSVNLTPMPVVEADKSFFVELSKPSSGESIGLLYRTEMQMKNDVEKPNVGCSLGASGTPADPTLPALAGLSALALIYRRKRTSSTH